MRLRNVKNAKEKLEQCPWYVLEPEKRIGHWQEEFQNNNPIHLEIGCGKGQFLIEMAKEHPEINFIGIEKYESVLVRATEKSSSNPLNNLRFLCVDAKSLASVFANEITTLYLNFSDPWPKKRHAKRRLTSKEFLNIYEHIFKGKNHIIQKTDNISLFAYSLEMLSAQRYLLKKVSLDLANEDIPNIETEYEERFKKDGYKINYVEAVKEKEPQFTRL